MYDRLIVNERFGNGQPTEIDDMMRVEWWQAMWSNFLLCREVSAAAVTRSGRG